MKRLGKALLLALLVGALAAYFFFVTLGLFHWNPSAKNGTAAAANTDPVGLYVFLGVMAVVGFAWAFFQAGLWRRGWGFVFLLWGSFVALDVVILLIYHFTHMS